jgi:hypothetical protein
VFSAKALYTAAEVRRLFMFQIFCFLGRRVAGIA